MAKKTQEPGKVTTFRASPITVRQLDELAAAYGENRSRVICRVIAAAHMELEMTEKKKRARA